MTEKKPSFPTQPKLVGAKVYLRPASGEDIANTYHWFLQSDPTAQSSRPHPFLSAADAAEAFKEREKCADDQLFMIVRQQGNTPVGQIRFFNWNTLNRSAELGLLIDPEERRKGHATEAIRLLAKFLFYSRDLNKLHAQTSSKNEAAVGLLEKAGFKRDAVLRHHYLHDGEFHDGYIYSLLRFEFGK